MDTGGPVKPLKGDRKALVRQPKRGERSPALPFCLIVFTLCCKKTADQLQPVVEPQLSHFRQVPLRTRVMLPHSPQGSPS